MWNLLWVFVVYSSANGTQDARYVLETWVVYGIGCSIVMAIAILVTGVGTHKHIHISTYRMKVRKSKRKQVKTVLKDIWLTLNVSRNYRILFIAYIVFKLPRGYLPTSRSSTAMLELEPSDILTIGLSLFLLRCSV